MPPPTPARLAAEPQPAAAARTRRARPPASTSAPASVPVSLPRYLRTPAPAQTPAPEASTPMSSVAAEASAPLTRNEALNAAMHHVQAAGSYVTAVEDVLVPAFTAARDAVDPVAATEIAAVIVQAVREARAGLDEAAALAEAFDPAQAVVTRPDVPMSFPEPEPLDFALHADLVAERGREAERLRASEETLLVALGPQAFRGEPVAGGLRTPGFEDRLDALIREASITVDLLTTVLAIEQRVATREPEAVSEAVGLAAMWGSRAINFRFLDVVLRARLGRSYAILHLVPGPDGTRLSRVRARAEARGRTFGMMADLGTFDPERAAALLGYAWDDWAVTDDDALDVFDMIASAAPSTRTALLEHLDDRGLLARLCANLPGAHIRALLDAIGGARGMGASRAAFTLQAALSDIGGGETASELYEEQIMSHIERGNYVRGYLWTLLDVSHSALTLGFKDIHDQAYVARREGLISSDAYWSTTAKAAGRTAVVLAATALTGGAAGGLAEGFALARGAGATTASLIGAGTGGGMAGLTGQFTADVYDQALLGREGFSSAGDYGAAFGLGAATGLVTTGIGTAGARYLPRSAQRMFEYHAGSPAGRYSMLQGPRQALHRGLYQTYRHASFAGRYLGRRTGLPPQEFEAYFEFIGERGQRHVFEGDRPGSGGHLWPPNPEGGPSVAGSGPSGPKSPFPRGWNQERIAQIIADAVSSPTQPWYRSGQVGVGPAEAGLPYRWPNPNTRFVTEVVVEGVAIRIVSRPGPADVITAFPQGTTDPPHPLTTIVPYGAFADGPRDE